jgi:hypothetical protein
MSTTKLLTSLTTDHKTMLTTKPQRGLAVRTDLRAGGWDQIDDQVAAWWNKLTGNMKPAAETTQATTSA